MKKRTQPKTATKTQQTEPRQIVKREGTLITPVITPGTETTWEDVERLARNSGAFVGPDHFCERAVELAREMLTRGELSKSRACSLLVDVQVVRSALAAGMDPHVIYACIGAGLMHAHLFHEKQDDARTRSKDQKPPITRKAYFSAVDRLKALGKRPTLANLAEELGRTLQAVQKFRRKNLEA